MDKNQAILDESESNHCIRALRYKVGDPLSFTDGLGNIYSAIIIEANPKGAILEITSKERGTDNRPYSLHMAVALTKNSDRFEWFLEKSVEIGVDRITPLICDFSERRSYRGDRGERIILSATKQSLKSRLPKLDAPMTAAQLIEERQREIETNLLAASSISIMGHCHPGQKEPLPSIIAKSRLGGQRDVLIMIGPEGDFSSAEVELATAHSFVMMTLGQSRLRVESAALMSVSALYLNYL